MRALLADAPRSTVRLCGNTRLHQNRVGPPPRRYGCNILYESFSPRQAIRMPPKLRSDNGKHVVIRPLAYVSETDIIAYADAREIPDHSLQFMWQPRKPATQTSGSDAQSMGKRISRPNRTNRTCTGQYSPLTISRPIPIRLPGIGST